MRDDFELVKERLKESIGLVPNSWKAEEALHALDRIEAENKRATKRAGELMAEVERLRVENGTLRETIQLDRDAYSSHLVRLRRIEEAARELGGIWDAIDATADDPDAPGVSWNVVEASLSALRSALKEKP